MNIINIHSNLFLQESSDAVSSQIGSILEPDPIAFSFETIGWKILLVSFLLLALVLLRIWYSNYKKNTYRRIGAQKLTNLKLAKNINNTQKVTTSMFVLKEIALQSYPRNVIASLTGINWLEFLSNSCKGTDFKKFKILIDEAIFKKNITNNVSNEIEELVTLSIKWVKNHA